MTVYPSAKGSVNTEGQTLPPGTDSFARLLDMLEERDACVVAYHPTLAQALGSVTAALLLSQFLHWTRCPTVQARGGWFYKRRDELAAETGLSRSEQETARRKLVKAGVLAEERRGKAGLLWFRVDLTRLAALVGGIPANPKTEADTSPSRSASNGSAGFPPPTETTPGVVYQRQQQSAGASRDRSAAVVDIDMLPEEERRAAQRLHEAGVSPIRAAAALVQEHGAAEVLRQIAAMTKARARQAIANPGAWLRRAIERRFQHTSRGQNVTSDVTSAPPPTKPSPQKRGSSPELPNSGTMPATPPRSRGRTAADAAPPDPFAGLWGQALAILAGLVNKPTYHAHFVPMRIVEVEGGCVTLGAKSHFSREWVERRHLEHLSNALAGALGRPAVSVIVKATG